VDGGLQTGDVIEDARSDAALFGLDPADFALPEDDDGIWHINLPVVTAYCAVDTQWRVIAQADGTRHHTGLDYAGVRAGLEQADIRLTPDQWADFQLVEAGAMRALNRRVPG
jgi:Phage related hypothetical protein (DUF1799)